MALLRSPNLKIDHCSHSPITSTDTDFVMILTCCSHDTDVDPLQAILVQTLQSLCPPGNGLQANYLKMTIWKLFLLWFSTPLSSPCIPSFKEPTIESLSHLVQPDVDRQAVFNTHRSSSGKSGLGKVWIFEKFNISSVFFCQTSCLIKSATVVWSLPFWPNSGQ